MKARERRARQFCTARNNARDWHRTWREYLRKKEEAMKFSDAEGVQRVSSLRDDGVKCQRHGIDFCVACAFERGQMWAVEWLRAEAKNELGSKIYDGIADELEGDIVSYGGYER